VADDTGSAGDWVTTDTEVVFTWTAPADVAGITGYEWRWDGGEWGATTATTVNVTTGEGAHLFEVRAIDVLARPGSIATMAVTVDLVAPEAPTGLRMAGPEVLWTAATDANGIWKHQVSVDAGQFADVYGAALAVEWVNGSTHSVAVRAVDKAGNVGPEATANLVMPYRPRVVGWGYDAQSNSIRAQFSEDVAFSDTAVEVLVRDETDGRNVARPAIVREYDAGTRTARFILPGLAGGGVDYGHVGSIRVYGAAVVSAAGMALDGAGSGVTSDFSAGFRAAMAGDADANRRVDCADYLTVRTNFGRVGVGWAGGDFDGSGTVDAADYMALWAAYGQSVVPAGTISGAKWRDTDADGVHDPGETAPAGNQVFLDADANGRLGAGEPVVAASADGGYEFAALGPGAYRATDLRPMQAVEEMGYTIYDGVTGFYMPLAEGPLTAKLSQSQYEANTPSESIKGRVFPAYADDGSGIVWYCFEDLRTNAEGTAGGGDRDYDDIQVRCRQVGASIEFAFVKGVASHYFAFCSSDQAVVAGYENLVNGLAPYLVNSAPAVQYTTAQGSVWTVILRGPGDTAAGCDFGYYVPPPPVPTSRPGVASPTGIAGDPGIAPAVGDPAADVVGDDQPIATVALTAAPQPEPEPTLFAAALRTVVDSATPAAPQPAAPAGGESLSSLLSVDVLGLAAPAETVPTAVPSAGSSAFTAAADSGAEWGGVASDGDGDRSLDVLACDALYPLPG
jgi:hypothetical protein